MKAVRCVLLALVLAPSLRAEEKPVSFWDQKEAVLSAAFSPDSRCLATAGGDDGSISIWDMETMQRKQHITDTGRMHHLLYTPDGKSLVVAGEGPISDKPVLVVIPLDGGKRRYLDTSFAAVAGLALSLDGKRVTAVGEGGAADLIDVAEGKRTVRLTRREEVVARMALSPDGKLLATVSHNDKVVKVWDVEAGKEKHTLRGHRSEVRSVVFSRDGNRLISGGGHELLVWNLATGTSEKRIHDFERWFEGMVLSPDGRILMTVQGLPQGVFHLWDWPTGTQRLALQGPPRTRGVCFSADGRWIFAFGWNPYPHDLENRCVRLWDLRCHWALQNRPRMGASK